MEVEILPGQILNWPPSSRIFVPHKSRSLQILQHIQVLCQLLFPLTYDYLSRLTLFGQIHVVLGQLHRILLVNLYLVYVAPHVKLRTVPVIGFWPQASGAGNDH